MSDFLFFKDYFYVWCYMGCFEKLDFVSYIYQGFSF